MNRGLSIVHIYKVVVNRKTGNKLRWVGGLMVIMHVSDRIWLKLNSRKRCYPKFEVMYVL